MCPRGECAEIARTNKLCGGAARLMFQGEHLRDVLTEILEISNEDNVKALCQGAIDLWYELNYGESEEDIEFKKRFPDGLPKKLARPPKAPQE